MKKRSYSDLQADLAAANREVSGLMDEISAQRKQHIIEIRNVADSHRDSVSQLAQLLEHTAQLLHKYVNGKRP